MRFSSRLLLALLVMIAFALPGRAQSAEPQQVVPGVWFLVGDASKGYSNTAVIEMKDYLIVVDANYPGRAQELIQIVKTLSPKPVRYVFLTHHHGDHAYGSSVWTRAGALTLAHEDTLAEMNRFEPARWQREIVLREDVRALGETDLERPKQTFRGERMVLEDSTRRVEFLHYGWGHTKGDSYVWLPKERVLCTGDAAVNGPRNNLKDASLANWPRVLEKVEALKPVYVLPGHGEMGGAEILSGQRWFLLDLYNAVDEQVKAGKTLEQIQVTLPERDQNWVPRNLSVDIECEYREITHHQPAGAVEHVWH
jgi:glyoxylase-like metal-dependent hydrolase (beta-lactamase superfamily II)